MPFGNALDYSDFTRRHHFIVVNATPSGSYTLTGDPIDLSNITNTNFKTGGLPGKVPDEVEVMSVPGGYTAQVVPNPAAPAVPTLATAFAVKYFTGSGAELPAAAYPAALTATPTQLRLKGPAWSF